MIRGIIITFIIAIISVMISYIHPGLDALAVSIILGMLVGNLLEKRDSIKKGVNLSLRIFIPLGIILYGSQLVLKSVETRNVLIVPFIFLFTFSITYLFSKIFRINKDLHILLSAGLSVCGASAVAIISRLLQSKEEDTSISIISVMVAGLTGLLIYPFVWETGYLSENGFSLFTGTTLPMLGQVKIIGMIAGDYALSNAINIKLMRIFMLTLLIVWFGLIHPVKKEESEGNSLPFSIRFFLVSGFIILAIMTNTLKAINLHEILEFPSRVSLTIALTAIGLSCDFDSISEIGAKPLYTVMAAWIIVAISVFIISHNLY